MSIQCTTKYGFRYCAEVGDHEEMEKGRWHLEGWERILWGLMLTLFLVFLFIML